MRNERLSGARREVNLSRATSPEAGSVPPDKSLDLMMSIYTDDQPRFSPSRQAIASSSTRTASLVGITGLTLN
jgi:hypothetical protein